MWSCSTATHHPRLTITELPRQHVLADGSSNATQLSRPLDVNFDAPDQPVQWTNRVVLEVDTTGAADLEPCSLTGRPATPLRSRDGAIHEDAAVANASLSGATVSNGLLVMRLRRVRAGRRYTCDRRRWCGTA